ncbi:MAG: hypothetical protein MSG64_06450 [Pyrinomonadaceae bacterium MAG19_C2-C3]|nr:hypothetical protein [Pyrinomonadaceae bacterium MAG19_C2-C3]
MLKQSKDAAIARWNGMSLKAKLITIAVIITLLTILIWNVAGSIHDGNYRSTIDKLKANEQAARLEQAKAQGEVAAAKLEAANAKEELNEANQELENLRAETDRLRALSTQSVRAYEQAKKRPMRRTVITGDITDDDIRAAIERARAANANATAAHDH